MTDSLLHAKLSTIADVIELSTAEAAELFGELRAAVVSLGDRARMRKVAQLRTSGLPKTEKNTRAGNRGWFQHVARRYLQPSGDFSIEVATIVGTGLIGMVRQATPKQKATEAQTRLGREVAEWEKLEAKAGKQLECVQLQMAEWLRPLNIENSSLSQGWNARLRRPGGQGCF
jgi:hypothetical protein